jgi:asparagine synthase (glutamine-hydrolysing)
MCGIAGYWREAKSQRDLAVKMAQAIETRGPDDSGSWLDERAGIALAHRRLSILDLSPAGHQPMVSPCGRYVLVYNGEIYNHEDIRAEIESVGEAFHWRGHSDTETLLAALRYWGVKPTLHRLNGMFAFALWDRKEQALYLARDRMGEKPLYYGQAGNSFLFGSELKALAVHPDWRGEIDRDALALYLRHNYIPSPWSIYRGIHKLPAAHYLVVKKRGCLIGEPQCYWDLNKVVLDARAVPSREPQEWLDALDALLRDSIKRRMVADVPLGAFLSGGIDSSTVVALMQTQSSRPVRTFSIGFHEKDHDEAPYARKVAAHLGTDHTELYVTAKEAMDVIPSLPRLYDEPFSDSSEIPTYLVSRMARGHVKVCLSGDGGDELFCGYNRYALGHDIWSKTRLLPGLARQALSWSLRKTPVRMLAEMQKVLPPKLRVSNVADRLPKLAEVLRHRNGESFYQTLVSHQTEPCCLVIGAAEPLTILGQPDRLPPLADLRERMMYLDMMTYLPDDILVKLDRASMSVSLEGRVPLLDHRVVEFAWQLPLSLKYHRGTSKWILRQLLDRYVPPHLIERPKMGFGVPIENWLRGPLRDWAEGLLDETRVRREGYFDPRPIQTMWKEHLSGVRRWHYHIWDILVFQSWLESVKARQF